ncbi:MAG: acyltransferase [Sphingomonadales bacterium]|nr:acyltransferase [Sphingomonadales bacterium]MDE2168517.1 acyltransferase [Sphingomonadales bacterium]
MLEAGAEGFQFKKRLDSIQYLRAVAAMLIVMVHLSIFVKGEFLEKIFKLGSCGIDIFFVVCGFVSAYPMCWGAKINPLGFVIKRIKKIVPAYWAVTIFIFFVGIVKGGHASGGMVSPERLIKSLFFVPYADDSGHFFPILYVGWSLNLEIAFYAFYAICLKVKNVFEIDVSYYSIFSIALIGGVFGGSKYLNFYGSDLIVDFALGILCSKLISIMRWEGRYLIIVIFSLIFLTQYFIDGAFRTIIVGVCVALMLFSIISRELTTISTPNKFFVSAGNLSYYIYLLHPLAIKLAEEVIKK